MAVEASRMGGVEIPPSVVKATRAVLLSGLKGVPLVRFCRDYKALVGEEFPWRKLGFQTLVEMLNAMPDVVRFEFSAKDGGYRLYPIADRHAFMPSWFKKAQGRQTTGAVPVLSDVTASLDATEPSKTGDGLSYNSHGLVTIYVSWNDDNKTPMDNAAVLSKKDFLSSLMRKVGNPVQVFVHPKRYGFVRFKTVKEARNAITTYSRASVGGHRLTVRPATAEMNTTASKPRRSNHRAGKKHKRKREKAEARNVSRGNQLAQAPQANDKADPSDFRPLWVRFNPTGLDRSRDGASESPDLATRSGDCHVTAGVRSGERLCVVDPSIESVEADSALGDDDSSLEWDEELLRNPILFPDAADVPIPHPKFPNMDPASWEVILQKCSGRGSWFERFGGVCSDASLVVSTVCSACHFWAKIDDKTGNQPGIETCLRFLSPGSSSPPSPGSVCAAYCSQENTWKRCWYHECVDRAAVVFYIDEGAWDHVAVETLANLPPFVASLPMQAVPCVLSGLQLVTWSPEMLPQGAECLTELVRGASLSSKLMLGRESSSLDPIPVILVNQDTDTIVNAAMLTTGLATLANTGPGGASCGGDGETASLASEEGIIHQRGIIQGDPAPISSPSTGSGRVQESQSPWQLSRLNVPNESGLTAVIVSEVVSPEELWLQLSLDPEGDLERISQRIRALGLQRVGQVIQQGDVCCLRLRDASGYRRVRVEVVRRQVVPNQASVLWVDTGTTHTVPTDLLYALPAELAISAIPPFAIPCRLHGIESTYGDGQNWFPLDCQLLWKHLLHKQVFANFVKSPAAQFQPRLGSVKLYYDSSGLESVAATLSKEGCNVSLVDVKPATPLKNTATLDDLGSSACAMDQLRVREQPWRLSQSQLKTLTVADHTAFRSHPVSRSETRIGTANTVHRTTDTICRPPPKQAVHGDEVKNPALTTGSCFERTATASGPRRTSNLFSPEQDCRITSTSARQNASPWKRLQQLYEQL